MTMWYDEEKEALVDNRPDHNLDFDSEGRVLFNLDSPSRRNELIRIAEQLKEESDSE